MMLRPAVIRFAIAGCLRLNRNNITRAFTGLSYVQTQKLRDIVTNQIGLAKHGLDSSFTPVRFMGVESPGNGNGNGNGRRREVNYEDLVSLLESGDIQLIDVREPKEVAEGCIPGSLNIPVTVLKTALALDPEAFTELYSCDKPDSTDSKLVFYGHCNVKGLTALEIAHKSGYKKARHFPGGWEEWVQRAGGKG